MVVPAAFLDKLADISKLKPNSKDGQNIVSPFLDLFQTFLTHLDEKFDDQKKEMLDITRMKDEKILQLEDTITAQKLHISKLEDKMEDQCQYTRRESLVLSGEALPVCTEGEDCIDHVCRIIPDKLGSSMAISPADISIAHRIGPKPEGRVDRRNIIVRFCRRKTKYEILNKIKKMKPKPEGLYISESLTPTKQKIMRVLRSAKKEFGDKVSGYNTSDGTVYVWLLPPNPDAEGARNSRVTIENLTKLEKFCKDNFDRTISYFLQKSTPANTSH